MDSIQTSPVNHSGAPLMEGCLGCMSMVETMGLEPTTPCLQSSRGFALYRPAKTQVGPEREGFSYQLLTKRCPKPSEAEADVRRVADEPPVATGPDAVDVTGPNSDSLPSSIRTPIRPDTT